MSTPRAVWEGTFTIFGVVLHCYVLDDGSRVIDVEDIERLFTAPMVKKTVERGDIEAFSKWRAGVPS